MESLSEDLRSLILNKVRDGERLLLQVQCQFTSVEGSKKLERRIRSEMKFLQKLIDTQTEVKKEHILSSNLYSLAAVVNILQTSENPTAVFKPFSLENGPINRIEVDVVSRGGALWHKAIARKAEALEDISKGRSSCGQKSVIDQAIAYQNCARLHPHLFNPPQVVFHFFNSISSTIASKLRKMGVEIEGEIRSLESSFSESDTSNSSCDTDDDVDDVTDEENYTEIANSPQHSYQTSIQSGQLFLDITCMVAYVSSMTNGGANFRFPKTIYNQQAEWERKSAAKPKLDTLFRDKQLVTCRQALNDFQTLVERMGGPGEKIRTHELVQRLRLHVVEDSICGRIANLQLTSNVKTRSRLIFNTADHLGIVIVTANTGFVRSAASQGMEIAHHVHEPRVLTEQQEVFSVPLKTDADLE